MADPAPRSHVIADRYLTSPAALASHPFGPVDALDTHSGRGAQVRIVFAGGEWDEAGLAEAVARWCGIGCSEVCGVLDFGRHARPLVPRPAAQPGTSGRALAHAAPADRRGRRPADAGLRPAGRAGGRGRLLARRGRRSPMWPSGRGRPRSWSGRSCRAPAAGRRSGRATASGCWRRCATPRSDLWSRRRVCVSGPSGRARASSQGFRSVSTSSSGMASPFPGTTLALPTGRRASSGSSTSTSTSTVRPSSPRVTGAGSGSPASRSRPWRSSPC